MVSEKLDLEKFEVLLTTWPFAWKKRFRHKRVPTGDSMKLEKDFGDGHLEQRRILQKVILQILAHHKRIDFDHLFTVGMQLRYQWSQIRLGREKVLASREKLEYPERRRRARLVEALKEYRKGRSTWDLPMGEPFETIDHLLDKLPGDNPSSGRLPTGQAHVRAFRRKAHKALTAVDIPKGLARFRQKLLKAFPEGTPEPTPTNLHDGLLMAWGLVGFRQD